MGKRKPQSDAAARRAEYRRNWTARQSREDTAAARDIGDIPRCKSKRRRNAALKDFRKFCETYFPERFPLKFSKDHLTVIKKTETAILTGGLFAIAMPRGSGKTTIVECAVLFALLTAVHQFVCLVASDKEAAVDILDSIKGELETNELLAADFPEVCYPIGCLEGIAHRCKGQTHYGQRTHIGWTSDRITLPSIEGSKCSGATVRCYGITGRIRGAKHQLKSGQSVRPSLVVIDDPQTDEVAASPAQCAKLERVLNGAVLGLAGPGRKISGVMPCTVIAKDDLADRLLNPDIAPEWHGERCRMLYSMPARMDLWDQYNELRIACLQSDQPIDEATAFYKRRKKLMSTGASVAWPERRNEDELDGLQHAMNLYYRDPYAFALEFQNDPDSVAAADDDFLDREAIMRKTWPLKAGIAALDAAYVAAFVDVQKTLLYYAVIAVSEDFTGGVIEYGAFPKQPTGYFTLRGARNTLKKIAPTAGAEGRIVAGLQALVDQYLATKIWLREDGHEMRLGWCLVDAGYETETVSTFIRASKCGRVLPSYGRGIKAGDSPMSLWRAQRGDRVGPEWRIPNSPGKRLTRHCLYDANHWKTFAHQRLSQPFGDRGALCLYDAGGPTKHRMLADHLTAESWTKTAGKGRECIEWTPKPTKPDNHLFDCVAGACVSASILGARLPSDRVATPRPARSRKAKYF